MRELGPNSEAQSSAFSNFLLPLGAKGPKEPGKEGRIPGGGGAGEQGLVGLGRGEKGLGQAAEGLGMLGEGILG